MSGGFGVGPFGVGEFGIDEYSLPEEIWIDPVNGSDDTGDASKANPIKSIDAMLPLVSPGVKIYVVGMVTGQPNYFYNIIDSEFWDTADSARVMAFIRAVQYDILAQTEVTTDIVRRDYYLKFADELLRFSSLFPVYARTLAFEDFRKRLLDIWFGYHEPETVSGINRIVGAYTNQPMFTLRLFEDENIWIIGVSYLNQTPPETYLMTYADYLSGSVIDVFNKASLTTEVIAEFENIVRGMEGLAPYYIHYYNEEEPLGYLLLKKGWHNFDLMELENMQIVDNRVELITVDTDASFVTPPLDLSSFAVVGYEIPRVWLNIFEHSYSESIQRKIYYRQADTEAQLPLMGFNELDDIYPIIINVTATFIQFKFEITGVKRIIDYSFVSLMLKYFPLPGGTQ